MLDCTARDDAADAAEVNATGEYAIDAIIDVATAAAGSDAEIASAKEIEVTGTLDATKDDDVPLYKDNTMLVESLSADAILADSPISINVVAELKGGSKMLGVVRFEGEVDPSICGAADVVAAGVMTVALNMYVELYAIGKPDEVDMLKANNVGENADTLVLAFTVVDPELKVV